MYKYRVILVLPKTFGHFSSLLRSRLCLLADSVALAILAAAFCITSTTASTRTTLGGGLKHRSRRRRADRSGCGWRNWGRRRTFAVKRTVGCVLARRASAISAAVASILRRFRGARKRGGIAYRIVAPICAAVVPRRWLASAVWAIAGAGIVVLSVAGFADIVSTNGATTW